MVKILVLFLIVVGSLLLVQSTHLTKTAFQNALTLTSLHPLATNALKSRPLLGQMNSGFKLLPEILGQKETFRVSMA